MEIFYQMITELDLEIEIKGDISIGVQLIKAIDLYRIRFCNRGRDRQSNRLAKHNDN